MTSLGLYMGSHLQTSLTLPEHLMDVSLGVKRSEVRILSPRLVGQDSNYCPEGKVESGQTANPTPEGGEYWEGVYQIRTVRGALPKFQWHKARKVYRVDIRGKSYYLGKDLETAKQRYIQLVSGQSHNGHCSVSLSQLLVNHQPSDASASSLLKSLREQAESSEVSLLALKPSDIERLILGVTARKKWSRNTANKALKLLKSSIYKAAKRGEAPVSAASTARLCRSFRPGELGHERAKVRPVEDSVIEATLKHLNPRVATMIRLQRLTGMRPGEVCRINLEQIDRTVEPWVYRPEKHKTAYLGEDRAVPLGPQARALVLQLTDKHMRPSSYAQAIKRAAKAAGVKHWSPNQIRHTVGTEFRRKYGLDVAGTLLGHKSLETTQVYAERDERGLGRVIEETG